MKTKLLSLLVALSATTALWASNVITYTAEKKIDIHSNVFDVPITYHDFSNGTGTLIFNDNVTTIGDYAFGGIGLTSITIPNEVTRIFERAFYNCSRLASVTLPNSVTEIREKTFYGCSSLTSITIPNSVTTIGNDAFYGCTGLTSITIGNSVTLIGDGAFQSCSSLTSVTIPHSVTTIGGLAFYGCDGLTSVTIGNSVTTIGYAAFSGCTDLTSVTIGKSVTTIGESAFEDCSNLTSVTINSDHIVGKSYADDYNLKNILGAQVEEYIIGNSVTTIGYKVFFGCSSLTSIVIGNSVTTIGESAFDCCTGLTSVTIGNSVTTIGEWAFSSCHSLTSLTIPHSVTEIGDYAFYGCYSLTSVVVDDENTTYDSRNNCNAIIETSSNTLIVGCNMTTIPNSVTTIRDYAFLYCSGLTSVTIPNSVTTIGGEAFAYCENLTSINIGNSVTTIGSGAFSYCSGLTSVTCYAVTPPECGYYVFEDVNQDAKVYVPASVLTDYQNAEVWKDMQLYPIAAEVTPMDDENPIVTPTDQDVTITWPITDGTDTYTITITKNGETVCVLTFNAQGQLVNIAFKAPAADGAHQAPAATLTAQGYQFTVTGLNPGTAYNYSVVATDAGSKTIAEHKGNFSTTGGTGLESVHDARCTMHKVLRNGQLLIETNNATYTPMGQKVR